MITFKQTDKCELRNSPLKRITKAEKSHGRFEKRTAFVTHEVDWLKEQGSWEGVGTIGAIVTDKETRYYISSRELSPSKLLELTRKEWAIESMHWQLDVIWGEDKTTLHDANTQKTLNILRKSVMNVLRVYRDKFQPKLNMVDISRRCLHDTDVLLAVLRDFDDCISL